jgi:hypothetical protein
VTAQPGTSARLAHRSGLGAVIGGTFGAIFLLANAQTPLGPAAADLFRSLAVLGFVLLVIGRRRTLAGPFRGRARAGAVDLFGRRWQLIVAGEVAALAAGYVVIRLAGAPNETTLAWTTFVVGVHFAAFRLAGVWQGGIAHVAAGLTVLGLAGLGLAATSETDWIPFVSGVLAGLTLLGGSLFALRRALAATGRPAENRSP